MTAEKTMSEMEKLDHLLAHWQEHNHDHAANYDSWAEKAEAAGKTEAAGLLRKAAEATNQITQIFIDARKALAD